MNEINLNQMFPSIEESKRRLKELKCKERELKIKLKLNMPMTDEEYKKLDRIGADIAQVEYMIEWIEGTDDDDMKSWLS